MEFTNYTATQDDDCRRLDRVLRKFLSGTGLSGLYRAVRNGLIKVNNKKVSPEIRIAAGDIISIPDFFLTSVPVRSSEQKKTAFQTLPKEWIVFKNSHILILNKPYGIPVQKAKKNQTSLDEIVASDFVSWQKNTSLSFKTGPLHRLDTFTTGLIAFSQSLAGAVWFSESIKNHCIKKIYYGIVQGKLENKCVWDAVIKKCPVKKNGFSVVESYFPSADVEKNAETIAIPLQNGIYKNLNVTLVKFELPTGRTHQIRATSAMYGYPLLGDIAYGGNKIPGRQFFLHHGKAVFPENELDIPLEIHCPLPADFSDFLSESLINFSCEL